MSSLILSRFSILRVEVPGTGMDDDLEGGCLLGFAMTVEERLKRTKMGHNG